jgi:hypothetical protein
MMTDVNMELGSNCKPLVDPSTTSSDQVKFDLQKSDRQEISLSTFDWPARCQVLPTIYDVTVRLWFCVTVTLSQYWIMEKRSKSFYWSRLYPTVTVAISTKELD